MEQIVNRAAPAYCRDLYFFRGLTCCSVNKQFNQSKVNKKQCRQHFVLCPASVRHWNGKLPEWERMQPNHRQVAEVKRHSIESDCDYLDRRRFFNFNCTCRGPGFSLTSTNACSPESRHTANTRPMFVSCFLLSSFNGRPGSGQIHCSAQSTN